MDRRFIPPVTEQKEKQNKKDELVFEITFCPRDYQYGFASFFSMVRWLVYLLLLCQSFDGGRKAGRTGLQVCEIQTLLSDLATTFLLSMAQN